MVPSVEKSLRNFMKRQEETINALEELRTTVKNHGSLVIKENIMEEDFDSVSHVVGELNNFTQLEYHSNMQEVVDFVRNVFGEMELKEAEMSDLFPNVPIEIEDDVKNILQLIGQEGLSRTKDLKSGMTEEMVTYLEKAGMLNMESIKWGADRMLTFELTSTGREKYRELFNADSVESVKSRMMQKFPDLEKGYFMTDMQRALDKREFNIQKLNDTHIEIEENNYNYYLTPDMGEFAEEDYFKILDKKNSMKSIGFICIDEQTLENKTKKAVEKWVKKNGDKCKFLSIHFTTIDKIENEKKVFETISF